jgi:ribosomal protection tetracycline resistance protein
VESLNLGILAHVDAGKTSLTERLLYASGVIDALGSVDDGSTRTDSLALERQRGITIKSAVVSFALGGVTINLIDTPGHPEFIAEVERVLGVLDGAVLVVSAVEGVQAQTRVLMRTLRRLRIPTLIFVNKIDRAGAQDERLMRSLGEKLAPVVAMGSVSRPGTRSAAFAPFRGDAVPGLHEVLAEHDDALLAAFVDERATVPDGALRAALAAQTRQALVHPVFFGSAITGAGVDALAGGVGELLPAARGDAGGPVAGAVFKVDRGGAGEKIAYVRLFSGTVHVRDRLPLGERGDGKVTAIRVFEDGADVPRTSVSAGRIGKLWGLADVRIGDAVGAARPPAGRAFAPPTLETVVEPRDPADRRALFLALSRLAEQDPLIGFRQEDAGQELAVSLYGEVQKEVIEATLAGDFGVAATFHETTTICLERPVGTGAAFEIIDTDSNPFLATVGLRVEPGRSGGGVTFGLEVELGSMPYAFFKAVEETVHATLRHGLHGWQVTDCRVTMTHSGYWPRQSHAHATFDKSMSSTAGDFRGLTRLVVMRALAEAGTEVLEPLHAFRLELPADALGAALPVLGRLRAVPGAPVLQRGTCLLEGEIPAASVHELTRQLPGLTRGEGVLETAFARHEPVRGAIPTARRASPVGTVTAGAAAPAVR